MIRVPHGIPRRDETLVAAVHELASLGIFPGDPEADTLIRHRVALEVWGVDPERGMSKADRALRRLRLGTSVMGPGFYSRY